MDFDTGRNEHAFSQTLGVITSLALAVLLAKLGVMTVSPGIGTYGGIGLMFAAIVFGVPLFVVTLGITIHLANKSAIPPLLAAVMWLPILASLAVIPVSEFFSKRESAAYASTHPGVKEIHVNLTGRDLRLHPLIGSHPLMEAKARANFLSFDREPVSNRGDKMAACRGVLLAPDFKSMPVIYGPSENGVATSVPVVLAPTPPGWAPFLPELGTRMAKQLVHYYFHYPDHIEVASAIDWAHGDIPQYDNGKPASGIYIHNLTSETIVRLEVNGETVPFYVGVAPLRADHCTVEHQPSLGRPRYSALNV